METKSFRRSSDEPISVRAVLGSGFKKCCMLSGHYDGSRRNYFFPRIETVNLGHGAISCRPVLLSRLSELPEPILRNIVRGRRCEQDAPFE